MKKFIYLLLLLGMTLGINPSYAKIPVSILQLKKSEAQFYFGEFLNSDTQNALSVFVGGGEYLQIPLDREDTALNDSFTNYLKRKKIFYTKTTGDIDEKYERMLKKIWYDIPDSISIPNSVKWYLYWENNRNQKNDPKKRHAPLFSRLEYFNIPRSMIVEQKTVKNLKLINDSHVMWPIHPEDEKYVARINSYLQSKKLDPKVYRKDDLFGILTSTNLVLVFNPKNNNMWFVKLSNSSMGNMKVDRKLLKKGILATNHIALVDKTITPAFSQVISTSFGYAINHLDLAVIYQQYPAEFMEGKKYLLPGTAALNMKSGAEIAEKNGSKRVDYFWRIHFNMLAGIALGELAGLYGFVYEIADLSKFMVELDDKFVPTGKMILGGICEVSILKKYFKHNSFLKEWPSQSHHKKLSVNFDHFSGFIAPTWILEDSVFSQLKRKYSEALINVPSTGGEMDSWKNIEGVVELKNKLLLQERIWSTEFFSFFQKGFFRISGIKLGTVAKNSLTYDVGTISGSLTRYYPNVHTESGLATIFWGRDGMGYIARTEKYFTHYLTLIPCLLGDRTTTKGATCSDEIFKISGRLLQFKNYYDQKICGLDNPFESLDSDNDGTTPVEARVQ